jgi:hypothetical protein
MVKVFLMKQIFIQVVEIHFLVESDCSVLCIQNLFSWTLTDVVKPSSLY